MLTIKIIDRSNLEIYAHSLESQLLSFTSIILIFHTEVSIHSTVYYSV